ncbi:hypothetical protein K438DRAFT_1786682 [Mycena galopus ATCC 62051]|nr:hypothetical protein K438DRAFT_1786682 [Mycena galopus ATCC 62051]
MSGAPFLLFTKNLGPTTAPSQLGPAVALEQSPSGPPSLMMGMCFDADGRARFQGPDGSWHGGAHFACFTELTVNSSDILQQPPPLISNSTQAQTAYHFGPARAHLSVSMSQVSNHPIDPRLLPCIPEDDDVSDLNAPTTSKIQSLQPATKIGSGSPNFSGSEVSRLLDIVSQRLPLGSKGWKEVMKGHNRWAKDSDRPVRNCHESP